MGVIWKCKVGPVLRQPKKIPIERRRVLFAKKKNEN